MKAVPLLLKHVRSIFLQRGRDESFDAKLEKLTSALNKIKDVFMGVRQNEDELLDVLVELDSHLRKLDKKKLDEEVDDICKRISDSALKLLPVEDENKDEKSEKVPSDDDDPSSSQQHKKELEAQDLNLLWESYRKLGSKAKDCLLSLSVFPENAVIKKRQAIYWWIGEGLVRETSQKTAEEEGEDVINQLLKFNVIVPHGNGDEDGLKPERLIHTVFNVGASYLDFRSDWSDKLENDLVVLQLGCWQDLPLHHIEVGSEEFLNELRNLMQLKQNYEFLDFE
ncbi:hypothetical protein JHK85_052086 [Glycine max]|nr:hypothetical protein JHK85_052086 [Glycine max]